MKYVFLTVFVDLYLASALTAPLLSPCLFSST